MGVHSALRTRPGTGTDQGVRGYGIAVHHTLIPTSSTVDHGQASAAWYVTTHAEQRTPQTRGGCWSVRDRLRNCALDNVIARACAALGTTVPVAVGLGLALAKWSLLSPPAEGHAIAGHTRGRPALIETPNPAPKRP